MTTKEELPEAEVAVEAVDSDHVACEEVVAVASEEVMEEEASVVVAEGVDSEEADEEVAGEAAEVAEATQMVKAARKLNISRKTSGAKFDA